MIGLAALALGTACAGPVCNFDTLAPYFARAAGAREARGMPPVHILQIGDSHSAGDVLTGGWRDLLQVEGGSGGRGVMAPGRPYAGYFTRGVTASMSSGWRVAASFGPGSAEPRPLLGLSGFSLTATVPGARMGLAAGPGMEFDRFVLCGVMGPGAGNVAVRIGGVETVVAFAGEAVAAHCETIRSDGAQSSVEVEAIDAPVTLTSWASFHDDGGIVLSNLGTVGAQLRHFARVDDGVLAEEMRAYAPDLIVLAFGTNEGFGPRIDRQAVEAVLRTQIARVQALAPEVSILLLGAPDALSRMPALRSAGAVDCGDRLFAPAGLAQVRAIQRKVAGDLHLAYWDWQARMGGVCSARRWVASDPARMRGDYVHFRTPGGAALARLLQDDLNQAAAE